MFSPEVKKGSVELIVLSLLRDGPSHAYDLGKFVQHRSGGRLEFPLSTIYPVLYRMEARKWVKGTWLEEPGKRRRRTYALTRKGREVLAKRRENWKEYTKLVNLVIGLENA
jgi:DNA-binding PadR family transcriptional regulator